MYSIKSAVCAVRRSPVRQSRIFNADDAGTKLVLFPPILEKGFPLRSNSCIVSGDDAILCSVIDRGKVIRLVSLFTGRQCFR